MFSCAAVFDFVDESLLEGWVIHLGFCLDGIDLRREDAKTRESN